jgi:hypothetical protein
MVLSYLKNHPVYFLKHNVSETGFYFRLQVKPTEFQFQYPKRCVLKNKQGGVLDKDKKMYNVRNIIFVLMVIIFRIFVTSLFFTVRSC